MFRYRILQFLTLFMAVMMSAAVVLPRSQMSGRFFLEQQNEEDDEEDAQDAVHAAKLISSTLAGRRNPLRLPGEMASPTRKRQTAAAVRISSLPPVQAWAAVPLRGRSACLQI